MNYTIMTRARRHGFYFAPHELEPLGITETEGARCWGLWVEGRDFDAKSRLVTDEDTFSNETPHLAVSAIHPDFWPTAFNLEFLIQRRSLDPTRPEECDAFLGFADALARCGVNILYVRTAQIGYDLISVNATCELPYLRPAASKLVKLADQAGLEMQQLRRASEGLSDETRTAKLRAKDTEVYRRRVAAFQALGLLMVPRLADLEVRLTAMDHLRFAYDSDPVTRRALVENACTSIIDAQREAVDGNFAVITGHRPGELNPQQRRSQVEAALGVSWFFNRKVVSAGENMYYLSYNSVRDRQSAQEAWPLEVPTDLQHIDHHTELGKADATALYEQVFKALCGRRLGKFLSQVIPESPDTRRLGEAAVPRSGTAERVQEDFDTAAEFERGCYRDFFHRQALRPVTISSLPSLAHMRFWAYAGAADPGEIVELAYRENLLRPDVDGPDGAARLQRLFKFLNDATGNKPGDSNGSFGPYMAVFANMNLKDRFVRLRFAREPIENRQYLTVSVNYSMPPGPEGQRPEGLLKAVSELLSQKGFRVERVSNTILSMDSDYREGGVLRVMGRAAREEARALCWRINDGDEVDYKGRSPRDIETNEWETMLCAPDAHDRGETIKVSLQTGFVQWHR